MQAMECGHIFQENNQLDLMSLKKKILDKAAESKSSAIKQKKQMVHTHHGTVQWGEQIQRKKGDLKLTQDSQNYKNTEWQGIIA